MNKIFVFIFVILLFSTSLSFAQITSSANKFPPVNYTLPYPGLLPDNPLYKFKVARDMIVDFFISDPISKADYDLVLSDKRLQASQMLYDMDEKKLALSTVSKSQNYFEQAINQLALAQKQNEVIGNELNKMENSNKLREYMLDNMIIYSDGSLKNGFKKELNRAIDFQNRLKAFSKTSK